MTRCLVSNKKTLLGGRFDYAVNEKNQCRRNHYEPDREAIDGKSKHRSGADVQHDDWS